MSASNYATDFVRSVKCQPGELTPPYSNEIWSVIPRLSAMRSNCSMVGLSFPQLILFRYCLVQPNLLANSASLMFFLANAFFKSIFVSFFISLWARHSPKQGKKKKDTPSISGSILSNETIILLLWLFHGAKIYVPSELCNFHSLWDMLFINYSHTKPRMSSFFQSSFDFLA